MEKGKHHFHNTFKLYITLLHNKIFIINVALTQQGNIFFSLFYNEHKHLNNVHCTATVVSIFCVTEREQSKKSILEPLL